MYWVCTDIIRVFLILLDNYSENSFYNLTFVLLHMEKVWKSYSTGFIKMSYSPVAQPSLKKKVLYVDHKTLKLPLL